jgi:dCMP deaminase
MKAELTFEGGTGIPLDKWDSRFLKLAHFIAEWSRDPSTKVGAVIVKDKRIVSSGFNGFPAGVNDLLERYEDREEKLLMTVHAGANAIVSAGEPLLVCTIYVTRPPCASCAGKIIQAGIKKVICSPAPEGFFERWKKDMNASSTMFHEAGVALIQDAVS